MKLPTINTEDYLPCARAAEKLGITPDSVRQYCNNYVNGNTPALEGFQPYEGADWLIHKDEIARYKRERRGRGRPPAE